MTRGIVTDQVQRFFVDGEEFKTYGEARKHFGKMLLGEWADKVGLGRGGMWDEEMILDAILDNADDVRYALGEYLEIGPEE